MNLQTLKKSILVSAILSFWCTPAGLGGVIQDYNSSKKWYASGKTSRAIKKLKSTLKKYPRHQPSVELLAQIYLDKKRYKSAARLIFRKKLRYINGDITFKLGIYYYGKTECRFTEYFLRKVPAAHRHFDDALIYRSVCLMRNQKWTKAYTLLRKARNPNPSLASTKQELLRIARDSARAETSGFRSNSTIGATPRAPILNYYTNVPYRGGPTGTALKPTEPEKKEIETGFDFKSTPKFEVESLNDQKEKHGFANVNSSKITYTAEGDFNAVYDFKMSNNRIGKFYSGFSLGYATNQSSGENIVNEFSASNPDQIVSESTPIDDDGLVTEVLTLKVSPGLSFPFNPYWNLALDFAYQKLMMDKETGYRELGASTNVSVDSVALSLAFKNKSNFDTETDPTSSSNTISAALSKDWEKLSADLNVKFSLKGEPVDLEEFDGPLSSLNLQLALDYSFEKFTAGFNFGLINRTPNDKVALDSLEYGATQQIALKGNVNMSLPYNISISVNADFETLTDYILPSLSTESKEGSSDPGDIKAQGQKFSITPVITYKPLDFLSIKLSYGINKYEYTTEVPEDQAVFEQKVNNLEKKFTGVLSVSKTI